MRVLHHYFVTGYLGLAAMLTTGCGNSPDVTAPSAQLGAIDIRVATSASVGDHDPDGYLVRINGGPDWPIGINDTRSFGPFAKGSYQVLISGLAPRCSVDGDNPRSVDVIGNNAVSHLVFSVTCVPSDDSGAGDWDY